MSMISQNLYGLFIAYRHGTRTGMCVCACVCVRTCLYATRTSQPVRCALCPLSLQTLDESKRLPGQL